MPALRNAEMENYQPRWVLLGGMSLAFMVSAVNVDFMMNVGVSVSHLTGDVSRLTAEAMRDLARTWDQLALLGLAVGGFVLGAMLAGVFIHHPRFDLHRPYGRSIVTIGSLFLVASFARPYSLTLSSFSAALACGMQNGLATHYRGMVLRTTHITGILTDLGVLLGMRLRGISVESWRIWSQSLLVISFATGAAAGAIVNLYTPLSTLVVFGIAYVLGGLGWVVAKRTIGRKLLDAV